MNEDEAVKEKREKAEHNYWMFCVFFLILPYVCPIPQILLKMALTNGSMITEFVILGLTVKPELQIPLFILFLVTYVITSMANLALIILIVLNSHLHTPMYFFLFNLSFIDLCYSSVITPKMLMSFLLEKNIISYMGCMTQLYFFCFFAISECYLLTSMAYDRYVAICNPLLYNVAMSPKVCCYLLLGSYLTAFSDAMIHTGCVLRLSFCNSNTINHYFCDLRPLFQLSCTSTYVNEIEVFIVGTKDVFVSTAIIFTSYGFVLSSIFKLNSTESRYKAFSTCSSHIIAVLLFFGSLALIYLKPSRTGSLEEGKIFSILYTTVVPMMNPLIYSLRNKDVKVALSVEIAELSYNKMAMANVSLVTEFILLVLTGQSSLQNPLFPLFLGMYMITTLGNLSLIILIVLNSHLHTPMYCILFNLSFVDFCYSYNVLPSSTYFVSVISEYYVLTSVAYDRYVAICNPLLYNIAMSPKECSYLMSFLVSQSRLTFCDGNTINRYFCDVLPLLQLSCTSIYVNKIEISIVGKEDIIVAPVNIFISYGLILSSIFKMRSKES
ncbi:hypothetical protein U0070_002267, partial [Myodes glareolus]